MKTTKLQRLARFVYIKSQLDKIAVIVSSINTDAYNCELSKASETWRDNLEAKATELAKELGLQIFCQRDTRGASLYLVDSTTNHNNNYSNGLALGC